MELAMLWMHCLWQELEQSCVCRVEYCCCYHLDSLAMCGFCKLTGSSPLFSELPKTVHFLHPTERVTERKDRELKTEAPNIFSCWGKIVSADSGTRSELHRLRSSAGHSLTGLVAKVNFILSNWPIYSICPKSRLIEREGELQRPMA